METVENKNTRPRDYAHAKIYEIRPVNGGEEHERYFGSTTRKYLSTRLSQHKSCYKMWKNGLFRKLTVYNLCDKYGVEGCEIILIEAVKCNSNDELLAREKNLIQNNLCVNKVVPLRTHAEYYLEHKKEHNNFMKQYYIDNINRHKEYSKAYRNNNLDKCKEREQTYRNTNIDKIKIYHINYSKNNADKIKKYRKEHYQRTKTNYTCECGLVLLQKSKNRHLNSKNHLQALESKQL